MASCQGIFQIKLEEGLQWRNSEEAGIYYSAALQTERYEITTAKANFHNSHIQISTFGFYCSNHQRTMVFERNIVCASITSLLTTGNLKSEVQIQSVGLHAALY